MPDRVTLHKNHRIGTYTDDQVIFRTNVESSGEEKLFLELQTQGLEKMFHRRKELCGVCQYHHDTLPPDAMRQSLLIHPTIVINETLKIINPHYLKFNWPTDLNTNKKLDGTIGELCRQQS